MTMTISDRVFDIFFYATIGAILYFVLPEISNLVDKISFVDREVVAALKDVALVYLAVWLSRRHNNHKH